MLLVGLGLQVLRVFKASQARLGLKARLALLGLKAFRD